jgi:hypothetical protein
MSGGKTVNVAYIKKALAQSQLILKTKKVPGCHPGTVFCIGTISQLALLSPGFRMAAKV